MHLFPLGIIFSIYLVHHLGFRFTGNYSSDPPCYFVEDIAINCGSSGNSSAFDGREWVGDKLTSSQQLEGKTVSSKTVHQSLFIDPVPYMTARLSRSQFTYTFQLRSGQKFIRLHFYPVSYRGFERSKAVFTVRAGRYTLLSNFSPSIYADALGVKYFAKEFCVNVVENGVFNITFSPSQITTSKDAYSFINGIEFVSMPAGLYYTPDGGLGARVVGTSFRYFIDNRTALEMVHRLNVGGRFILSVEDLGGMFRAWSEDKNYLLQSGLLQVSTSNAYTNIPTYTAPPEVYQTAWSIGSNKQSGSFTWKLPVNLGFRYLVRLHFCELEPAIVDSGQKQFALLINGHMVESDALVINWSGNSGIAAIYRDYMALMEGNKMEGKRDIIITLQPKYESSSKNADGILKGIEIFKLSNPDNNLADSNNISTAHTSTSWTTSLRKLLSAFGSRNAIVTGMIVILTLLNVIIHQLINISPEQNAGERNISPSSMGMVEEEDLCRRFSLVEIKLATNNFDDKLVIGSGGFGKVYKGLIFGTTGTVAIKRLNLHSNQGANEFWTEIKTLSKLRHNHLVSLIGYCDQSPEMILVYDYMALGTLGDHLFKNQRKGPSEYSPLTWEQRLNICIGAAQGLDYLHTSRGVIHRDVKSSNILLDENLVAKISDFGLSKMDTTSLLHTHVSTNVKGTFGYLDPEYFMTRRLTKKSDVYAFGVVLFEVLCGRPAVDVELEEQLQHSLALWAQHSFREGTLDQIIDPSVRMQMLPHCLREFTNIAIKCLHNSPNERPTMTDVVESLKFAMMLWQGGADSYAEDEIVRVSESCKDEQIDGIVSFDPSPLTTKESEIKTKKKVKSSTPKTSKDTYIGKRKNDYGNRGPSSGWRDMLWGRRGHQGRQMIFL
ncbi:receptor-like protein kinase FERONIA [Cornus florida]|uniref:receptor-like protein kinase FERONIA n=1 Tax=Cornus florida TaxID=4283 RepID=UPI0028A09EAC|nr:receptor-like protein kinase FERONIA [Cornus florida]XP_059656448.1 receptor-like protein kinase FERONIA [Cornus florida]XP_059656449.1 receptor-like protein kinase FERONIA [Cornus florida]XP_059656450.1 receptor-like protein kinase FERONIA [Cornus florida]XP_059656451.1 receptor-like protein kinase FERONIA [Cornus florida]